MHTKAFIIMPFIPELEETFKSLSKICEDLKINLVRGDTIFKDGLIINQIQEEIKDSKFVLADFSLNNPNVMYEIGYAHALNKPTILLVNESYFKKAPFDISGFRYIKYKDNVSLKLHVPKYITNLLETLEKNKGGNLNSSLNSSQENYFDLVKSYVRKTYGSSFNVEAIKKEEGYTYITFNNRFEKVLIQIDLNGTILRSILKET